MIPIFFQSHRSCSLEKKKMLIYLTISLWRPARNSFLSHVKFSLCLRIIRCIFLVSSWSYMFSCKWLLIWFFPYVDTNLYWVFCNYWTDQVQLQLQLLVWFILVILLFFFFREKTLSRLFWSPQIDSLQERKLHPILVSQS